VTEPHGIQPHTLQLITAGNIATNLLESRISPFGLSLVQALILIAIRELPTNTAGPTTIARYIGFKRPSITSNLAVLVKRKLINEVVLPGKQPRFGLTATGEKITSKIDQAVVVVDQLLKVILPVKEHEFLDRKFPRIVSELRWAWAKDL
jgi:DNA-binding MarR family transcriptional regulator